MRPDDSVFDISSGGIKLLDIEDDGIYDVIFIDTYVSYFVKYINATDRKIYDRYGEPFINLDKYNKDIKYTIIKEGKEITFEELGEMDILTVQADKLIRKNIGDEFYDEIDPDATLFKITVVSNMVDGVITKIYDDKVTIDDKTYSIGEGYKKAVARANSNKLADTKDLNIADIVELKIGTEGTFHLDSENRIVAVETIFINGDQYGYLINLSNGLGLSKKSALKVLTADGTIEEYQIVDKIKLNDRIVKDGNFENAPELYNNGVIKQLINFSVDDDGLVKEIYTAVNNAVDTRLDRPITDYIGYDEKKLFNRF